jgi:C4-dicarboxylate-specific signal transduction histidine kinase
MTPPPTPGPQTQGQPRASRPLLLRPRDWPITAKFARDLGLAAIVPLLVAFWFNSTSARGALDDAARQNLQLLARVTATRLDQLLTDTGRAADQLGREVPIVTLCSAPAPAGPTPELLDAAGRKLALLLATNPDLALVSITDARGACVASTDPAMVGVDYTFRSYIREALAGKRHISEVLVGTTTRRPGVYFSTPVRAPAASGDGPVIGTATIKLQGERIWEIVDAVRIGDHGHAMLTDADGVVVAHPDRAKLYSSLAALPADRVAAIDPSERFGAPGVPALGLEPLAAGMLAAPAGALDYAPPPRGASAPGPWVAGFARLHLTPWTVTVTEPRSQFEAPMDRLARQQFIIVGLVALGAAGFALYRARSILRPVLDLTHAADRLAGGDLDARAGARGHDEIGRLAAVFNAMVPRLKAHVDLQRSLAVAMDVQKSLLP